MKKTFANAVILALMMGLGACNNGAESKSDTMENIPVNPDQSAAQQLTVKETLLFDGKSLDGWHGFNSAGEVKNWDIEDSALVCLGAARDASGGDLVTDKDYGNFELNWQWKVTKGGNSGVMYHVIESPKYKAPYETGPEYQMIDDTGFPEKLEEWQKSGADYAMTTANDKKKLVPVGEWNTSRILFMNGHVEHWLNGEKIVEFQAWDDKWNKQKKEGKWKDYPDYGTAKRGKIALQDHGHKVYFKNISIKEL